MSDDLRGCLVNGKKHNPGIFNEDMQADLRTEREGKMDITDKQLDKILEDFPEEALSVDKSRGFALTSIRAMYVIERLNQVFGVLGWGYTFTEPNLHSIKDGGDEYVTKVTLVIYDENHQPYHTISQYGGKKVIHGNHTDAHKSAVTDGLTKCASILGIGHSVFKGSSMPLPETSQVSSPQSFISSGDMTETIRFGKYKGKTMEEIYQIDKGYWEWWLSSDMAKSPKFAELREKVDYFLESKREV